MSWLVLMSLVLLQTSCISSDVPAYIADSKVTYQTCLGGNVFRTVYNTSFEQCIDECLLRKHCLSVSYYRHMEECKLRNSQSLAVAASDNARVKCMVLAMDGIDASHLAGCSTKPCDDYYRCNVESSGFSCRRSECDPIPSVPNAVPRADFTELEHMNSYQCNQGYSQEGPLSKVRCHDNGTWSSSDFECIRVCPRPGNLKFASLISDVSNRSIDGDVIVYQCFDGYSNYENKINQTRTCTNGAWVGGVACCRHAEGYEHDFSRCFRVYYETLDYHGAGARCSETAGAYVFGIGNSNQNHFITKILASENAKGTSSAMWDSATGAMSPLLISSKLSDNAEVQAAINCIVENGVQAINDRSAASFNQLVTDVESAGVNPNCDLDMIRNQYMNWAVNQPVAADGLCINVSPDDPHYWSSVSCSDVTPRAFVCFLTYIS